MPRRPTRLFASSACLAALACLALSIGACSSGDDVVVLPPGAGEPTNNFVPDQGTPAKPGANSLAFERATGVDGAACQATCTLAAAAGQPIELAVLYRTAEGAGIADRAVRFRTDADAAVATLAAGTAVTDQRGRAALNLNVAAGASGSMQVQVDVPDDAAAGSRTFVIGVDAAAVDVLRVRIEHSGTANVGDFAVRVFGARDGAPDCAALHPDHGAAAPSPAATAGPVAGHQVATVGAVDGLGDPAIGAWVVQVLGPGDPSATTVQAEGCVDGVALAAGHTTELTVPVRDLPLRFTGEHRVESQMDLVTGLPGDAGRIINLLLDIFNTPGDVVIPFACSIAEGTTDFVCDFLVNSDGSLSTLGRVAADIANDTLLSLLEARLGQVVFDGRALSSLLRDMRFVSTLTFESDPGEDGHFAEGTAQEVWQTGSIRWGFGQQCPAGDEDCGRQSFKLSDVFGISPQATIAASVDGDNRLAIERHTVPGFDYGLLIDFIMQRRVLPLLFGDGTDSDALCGGNGFETLPPVDNYHSAISVLFGDQCCLYFNDCCEFFASKISEQGGVSNGIAQIACEGILSAGAQWLRGEIIGLAGSLEIGTPADAPCQAIDETGDRRVDRLGSAGARCPWDAGFDVRGQPFDMTSDFEASRTR